MNMAQGFIKIDDTDGRSFYINVAAIVMVAEGWDNNPRQIYVQAHDKNQTVVVSTNTPYADIMKLIDENRL